MDEQPAAPETVRLLRVMTEVTERFALAAQAVEALPLVSGLWTSQSLQRQDRMRERTFRVGSGAGVRQEWYVEAFLPAGRCLSFSAEVGWFEGEWTLDASAIGYEPEAVELLAFPTLRTADLDVLLEALMPRAEALLRDAEALCSHFAAL